MRARFTTLALCCALAACTSAPTREDAKLFATARVVTDFESYDLRRVGYGLRRASYRQQVPKSNAKKNRFSAAGGHWRGSLWAPEIHTFPNMDAFFSKSQLCKKKLKTNL